VGQGEEPIPDALAVEEIPAPQERGQVLVDQPDDLEAVLAVVAVVDLADEPVVVRSRVTTVERLRTA
jgi:hypothetical protein